MRIIDADALREIWVCQPGHDFEPSSFVYSIDNAPTVEPASPWHRVEEPPKKEGACFCYGEHGVFAYNYWSPERGWAYEPNRFRFRYWMYRPEPPKEDADADKHDYA